MGYPTHAGSTRIARWKDALGRLGLVLAGLVFFTLSLQLMREGIAPLGVWFHTVLAFNSPAKALGFGWLFASIALSGSPVAATAISFFDAGILTQAQTFAMIAGSRLGASFIVLVVGFAHRLRGHQRALSYSAGLLSLLVTQSTYIIALPLGLALLRLDWLAAGGLNVTDVASPFELFLAPALRVIAELLPTWTLFPFGFLVLLGSFRLFDRALPDLHLEESRAAGINRLLYRPVVSFLLGGLVTAVTLSVSVSMSLLVPLSVRGYIRQENIIPYAMGANITTFIDTLVAAALIGNPAAVTVVLVEMISVGAVALTILLLGYRPYQSAIGRLSLAVGSSPARLAVYLLAIFLIPVLLFLGG